MSVWTYIEGYIKFNNVNSSRMVQVLGKIISFDDLCNNCDEECITSLPIGSEGSAEYKIYGETALFDSALRDFGVNDFDKILSYLKLVFEDKQTESCMLKVRVGTGEQWLIHYDKYFDEGIKVIHFQTDGAVVL